MPGEFHAARGGGKTALSAYFDRLFEAFGAQHWWPARTRLEVILGAILTQNTAWSNAALAVGNLRRERRLTLKRLRASTPRDLERCLRPAGFYRQKAHTIRNFLAWLEARCRGSLGRMFSLRAEVLRKELLAITGLGPETADAILLYAGRRPYFVADAYTRRILSRHHLIPPQADYAATQAFLHSRLPWNPDLFNEFHALLVEAGKRYCRRNAPRCAACPLEEFLPAGRLGAPRLNPLLKGGGKSAGEAGRAVMANIQPATKSGSRMRSVGAAS